MPHSTKSYYSAFQLSHFPVVLSVQFYLLLSNEYVDMAKY